MKPADTLTALAQEYMDLKAKIKDLGPMQNRHSRQANEASKFTRRQGSIYNDADKIIYQTDAVKEILREVKLQASKKQTTAVRGYNTQSGGYRLSGWQLTIHGASEQDKYAALKAKLEAAGMLESTTKPNYNLGSGYTSEFRIKPILELKTLWETLKADFHK